jgi:DNA-binding transcriptional MerR regulator
MTTPELLQIGEFAKATGTNLRTLRYYEEMDLIAPSMRSPGGFRFYDHHQLERVVAIRKLQSLGLSLAEIGEIMNVRKHSDGNLVPLVERALERHREVIAQKLEECRAGLAAVDGALQRLRQCRDCDVQLDIHCDPCSKDGCAMPPPLKALL